MTTHMPLIALVGLVVIVTMLLCVDTESFMKTSKTIRKGKRHAKKSKSLASVAPDPKPSGPIEHQGNIVWYGPVDPNLLQITATGVSY